MIAVRVMQVSVHEVIDVIAVGDSFVTTTGTMPVGLIVTSTGVGRRAVRGIRRRHLQPVLHHFAAGLMVQVAIMEVIHVVAVSDGGVAAAGTVLMVVIGVFVSHDSLLFCLPRGNRPGLCGMSQGIVDQVQHVLIG